MIAPLSDAYLMALDSQEFRALLERLPDQADELRRRRKRLQHAAWRERNRPKKQARDSRYYHVTSRETPEQRRARWKAATRRYRTRRERENLEVKLADLQAQAKRARGKNRENLHARITEVVLQIERLSQGEEAA